MARYVCLFYGHLTFSAGSAHTRRAGCGMRSENDVVCCTKCGHEYRFAVDGVACPTCRHDAWVLARLRRDDQLVTQPA